MNCFKKQRLSDYFSEDSSSIICNSHKSSQLSAEWQSSESSLVDLHNQFKFAANPNNSIEENAVENDCVSYIFQNKEDQNIGAEDNEVMSKQAIATFFSQFNESTMNKFENEAEISQHFARYKSLDEESDFGVDKLPLCEINIGKKNRCDENFTEAQTKLSDGMNQIIKDKSLLFSGPHLEEELIDEWKVDIIKLKIENIFSKLIDDLVCNRSSMYRIPNQKLWSNCEFVNERLQLKSSKEVSVTKINCNSKRSRARFNLITFLLGKIYTLLTRNSACTKRELYYQIVNFVKNQGMVDQAVNSISCLLDVAPWNLGIMATSKGLVFGDLRIVISAEETVTCSISGGTLIPQDVTKITQIESNAYFILVVEKDSIFQKLLDEDVPNRLTRPFIMITGKGFPDVNTRLFLRKLWMKMSIPVFVLVDADPDGIEIMLTYKFGSLNMSHVSEQLSIPNLRWLGIHPSEITALDVAHQKLNNRDRNKIQDILKRPYIAAHPKLQFELQALLKNNFKAEIEGLIKTDTFLTNFYLPNKFYTQDYF